MISGHVTLNGLDDDQLIILIEGKKSHPGFVFNPSKMQAKVPDGADVTRVAFAIRYSEVTLSWHSEQGMKSVEILLGKLYRRERSGPVSH